MRLYMIRHGQSVANAERRHVGWGQTPLTEKGREDARLAGTLLCDVSFDRIYVSDLIRAKETLEIALPEAKGIETPLLREIGVGELSGKTVSACAEEYGERYLTNKAVRNFIPFGGESNDLHRERIGEFLALLVADPQPTVAAFCHEGSIQCVMEIIAGTPLNRQEIHLKNGSVNIFEYADGAWHTVLLNQTAKENQ
ncbi:MAG: histidine phosphatase family protein, partial [Clostridia bacterium]|nr:histidine phosphatase family protein [Clostridia bacterium]